MTFFPAPRKQLRQDEVYPSEFYSPLYHLIRKTWLEIVPRIWYGSTEISTSLNKLTKDISHSPFDKFETVTYGFVHS